jgi:hypothetical protein
LNTSAVFNIKHGNESDASEYEIDKNNRQFILNGLVYRDFKLNETDGILTFIEYNSKTDVGLAMRRTKTGDIEVEDWNNPSVWMSLPDYIEKLLSIYTTGIQLNNKIILEKRTSWEVHYTNVKRIISDLDEVFNVNQYYNIGTVQTDK